MSKKKKRKKKAAKKKENLIKTIVQVITALGTLFAGLASFIQALK